MATVNLQPDFKEFLKLLNAHRVEYLVIGGCAARVVDVLDGVEAGCCR